MSLQVIQGLELTFGIFTAIGFCCESASRWAAWLSLFLLLSFDTWRCLRVGEISTGPSRKWYGFTFRRDESPEFFTCVVAAQILLTFGAFLLFLVSL